MSIRFHHSLKCCLRRLGVNFGKRDMGQEPIRRAGRPLSWSERSVPIIAQIIVQNAGKDESEIRSALDKSYPFPERMYYPRKIWLEEVARQLNATFDKGIRKD